MGNRYFITGVQLGMLLAFAKDGGMFNEAGELIDEITDKQYLCETKELNKLFQRKELK